MGSALTKLLQTTSLELCERQSSMVFMNESSTCAPLTSHTTRSGVVGFSMPSSRIRLVSKLLSRGLPLPTDAPDGVRAGAKRLGRKATDKKAARERVPELEEAHRKGYVVSARPFSCLTR